MWNYPRVPYDNTPKNTFFYPNVFTHDSLIRKNFTNKNKIQHIMRINFAKKIQISLIIWHYRAVEKLISLNILVKKSWGNTTFSTLIFTHFLPCKSIVKTLIDRCPRDSASIVIEIWLANWLLSYSFQSYVFD